MKNPRRFRIPLRWSGTDQIDTARSCAMALPISTDERRVVSKVMQIESVGGRPQYRIDFDQSVWFGRLSVVQATKLELFKVGDHVLVEQPIQEISPRGVEIGGLVHYVKHVHPIDMRASPPMRYIEAICGKWSRGSLGVSPVQANCQDCLEVKAIWLHYVIEPYSHPDVIEKLAKKLRQRARQRERLPTVYDHLLLDPFAEDAVPALPSLPSKPPVVVIRKNVGQKPNHRVPVTRNPSYEEQRDAWLRKVTKR